jgi:hypothetical protein
MIFSIHHRFSQSKEYKLQKANNNNSSKQTNRQTNKQINKMVNSQQLQKETSAFLNKEVLAVGIFDVSLTAGKRNVAPAAAGLAAGLIT